MKSFSSPLLLLATLGVLATTPAPAQTHAHDGHHETADAAKPGGSLTPVTDRIDPAWLSRARASYPFDHCVVSGDKFDGGEMGQPRDFVYKTDGQPDRLVRLCCKDCVQDFDKDPAKYLDKLAAASPRPAGSQH